MKKAFIMAAGVGQRLRPLTTYLPKPMVPIANKPVLQHAIELLRRHGIFDLVINLHYRHDSIKSYFGAGLKFGVNIHYSYEPVLMGTSGGIGKARKQFDEDFIVMSGDGISDIDLTELMDFHKKKKCIATIVLKEVDSKFDYGVALLSPGGRITGFVEKPSWKDVYSNTVNTGVYVLSPEIFKYIPKDKPSDFGHDVWPALVAKGEKIAGYVTRKYWTDIGNLSAYRKAQMDAMDKKIGIVIPGTEIREQIWIDSLTKVGKKVILKSPCVIGRNCRIENGATVGPYTVISGFSRIAAGAHIENSVLWGRSTVERDVRLKNCIIGYKAVLKESISVYEGSVINVTAL